MSLKQTTFFSTTLSGAHGSGAGIALTLASYTVLNSLLSNADTIELVLDRNATEGVGFNEVVLVTKTSNNNYVLTTRGLYGTTANAHSDGKAVTGDDTPGYYNGLVAGTELAALAVGITKINATGTPSSTTFLRGDGTWNSATGSGAMTLLKANSGTDATATATTVDSYAITGLTALDTLVIVTNNNTVTAATAAGSIYHVTDAASIAATSGLAAAQGENFTMTLRQNQHSATSLAFNINGLGPVALGSGGTTTASVGGYNAASTAWTGSWSIGLRHGGVTATGTFRWSWAIYKVAGQ